jgi:hypothetical protein
VKKGSRNDLGVLASGIWLTRCRTKMAGRVFFVELGGMIGFA